MDYLASDKKIVQLLINQCFLYGVKHVVISPGSRNAPLIISFDNHPAFTCYSIPDERSAAFYALGMARQLNEPVAIVCTSGTAVTNYAPALTEAYYQEIPVIAITADRPPELIDQEDGQTIRQHNIFANHILYSTTLPYNNDNISIERAESDIQQAFELALGTHKGSVHINIPFNEPLYNTESIEVITGFAKIDSNKFNANDTKLDALVNAANKSTRIMVLAGVLSPNKEVDSIVNLLANEKDILVVAPATSNISGDRIINTPDLLIKTIKEEHIAAFSPELLITIGGPVVSKVTKQFLRNNNHLKHYDIDVNPSEVNTYLSLASKINAKPEDALKYIYENIKTKGDEFQQLWINRSVWVNKNISQFISKLNWCDIAAFSTFFNSVSKNINLHLANSTPVRYAELFDKHSLINYYCNRGTSGIDGSLSTAAGAALASDKTTVLITGDMSFVYDSNVFWNKHVPNNLRIILINNGGGNIFKIIPGPKTTNQLKTFFESSQNVDNELLCKAFNIEYSSTKDFSEFSLALNLFLESNSKCKVLEIFTNSDINEDVFVNLNKVLLGYKF